MTTPHELDGAEIERVVAEMTPAARKALFWFPSDGSWSLTRAHWTVANSVFWLERKHPTLAEAKIVKRNGLGNELRHRLLPLGIAVRAHLARTGHPVAGGGAKHGGEE